MAIQFDYGSVYNRLTDRMKKLSGDADVLSFGSVGLFLSVIAEMTNQLAMYNDYWTREAIYDTARNMSSVMNQVKVRGYKPKRPQGSVGLCMFSPSSDFITSKEWVDDVTYELEDTVLRTAEDGVTVKMYKCILATSVGNDPRDHISDWEYVSCKYPVAVTIPKRTSVSGGGFSFVTTEEVVLEPTMDYVVVTVKQGISKTAQLALGTSPDGSGFPYATIDDRNIDNSFYSVFVDGVEYTEIENIYWAGSGDEVFEAGTTVGLQGIWLKFGNGNFGKAPTTATVELKYLETEGLSGEINSAGVITGMDDTIYASENGTEVEAKLFVTNITNCTGSANADTIEDIKLGGITTYQSQNRAITKNDYETLITNHYLVDKCIVWGSFEDFEDSGSSSWDDWVEINDNKVHVCGYTPTGENLNVAAQRELMDYLYEKKSPLDVIMFEDVDFIGLAFTVTAYINQTGYTKESVCTAIGAALSSAYDIQNMSFKGPLYETKWKGIVNAVPGVAHHTSSLKLVKEFAFDDFSNRTVTGVVLPFSNIHVPSYELWIQNNTAATPSFVKCGAANSNDEWIWANGFSGSTETQLKANGEISIYNGSSAGIDHATYFTGSSPEDFTLRVYYNLGEDPESGQLILDTVPTTRNAILKFMENRSITAVYE